MSAAEPSLPTPRTAETTPADPAIDVCICSYGRPELVDTLAALSRQELGQHRFRVIVADNTSDGAVRDRLRHVADGLRLELHYLHAPANNISIARNACLAAARGRWIAFLDDDEQPATNWLEALLDEAHRGGWHAVLGPVIAIYPQGAPAWVRQADLHSTAPVWRHGKMVSAYTGNVLFRRDFAEGLALRFPVDLGTTGGEDEEFFHGFRDGGGRIGFAAAAVCYERVGLERASLGWLLRRNFRAGQSHGARLKRLPGRPRRMLTALAKVAFCAAGAAFSMADIARRNRYLTRGALHCGVVARLSGMREIRTY